MYVFVNFNYSRRKETIIEGEKNNLKAFIGEIRIKLISYSGPINIRKHVRKPVNFFFREITYCDGFRYIFTFCVFFEEYNWKVI